MNKAIVSLLFALLSACAQGQGSSDGSGSVVAAALPDASCVLYSTNGWHQFCSAPGEVVSQYDCGMRNGAHCWASVGATHSEAYCMPLGIGRSECQFLVP